MGLRGLFYMAFALGFGSTLIYLARMPRFIVAWRSDPVATERYPVPLHTGLLDSGIIQSLQVTSAVVRIAFCRDVSPALKTLAAIQFFFLCAATLVFFVCLGMFFWIGPASLNVRIN